MRSGGQRMLRPELVVGLGVILSVLLLVGGCYTLGIGYTKIEMIHKNPSHFDGKEVKVKGEVLKVLTIPFVETKFFVIGDGTGEITVATQSTVPLIGGKVGIRGTVRSLLAIGSQGLGLHVQETERW